jgi:hypothetical protein
MRNKIIYWVATLWFTLGMGTSAFVQISKTPAEAVENMTRLGYPAYFFTILGVWKVLGLIAILSPRLPLVKEWAYAGFFFVTTGALFSHLAMGDEAGDISPSVLLFTLGALSWYFRPESRRLSF